MNRFKRVSLLSLLLLTVSSFAVYALPSSVQRVTKMFSYIFFTLKATAVFPVFLKFCFFIMVFAVLFNGGVKVLKAEKEMRRAISIIAFVVALVSAIFVPYKVLLYIFRLYSTILALLFALLPVFVGFFINQSLFNKDTRTHHILRAILYFVIAGIVFGIIGTVEADSSPETQIYRDVTDWLFLGAVFTFIAAVFNLILAFGGGAAEGAGTIRRWFGGEQPEQPRRETPLRPVPEPPPVNPAEVQALMTAMANFMSSVMAPGGLREQYENQWTAYEPIHNQPASPAKQAAAQGFLASWNYAGVQTQINNLNAALNNIMSHAQYQNIRTANEPLQQQFEQVVAVFVQLSSAFCQLHALAVRDAS